MAGSAQRRKVYAQVTEVCLLELEKALRATSIAPESPAKLPKWIRALPASVSSVEAVVGGGKDVAIELSGPARIARGTGGQRTCGGGGGRRRRGGRVVYESWLERHHLMTFCRLPQVLGISGQPFAGVVDRALRRERHIPPASSGSPMAGDWWSTAVPLTCR
jgi:hypothetical protein